MKCLRRTARVVAIAGSLLFGAAFVVVIALLPPAPTMPIAAPIRLADVTLITPTLVRRENATMWIEDGRIRTGDTSTDPDTVPVMDEYRGHFVLPGLIDMHAHLPPKSQLGLTEHAGLMLVAHGVTTVRVLGDTDGTALPAARAAMAGGVPVPRIFSCGPFVMGAMPFRWPNSVLLHHAVDADALVAAQKAAGHVCIKAYEDLDRGRLIALKAACERYGLRMVGHLAHGLDYVDGLVPEVQHFHGIPPTSSMTRDHIMDRAVNWKAVDDTRLRQIVSSTMQHRISNTPTLAATAALLRYRDYSSTIQAHDLREMPRLYREIAWSPDHGIPFWHGIIARLDDIEQTQIKKRALTRLLYEADAELFLGTDIQQPFVVPGASFHEEMREFLVAGVPLEQIWAMATWKAADTLNVPGLGRLTDGAPADVLIFKRDPTRDIGALDSLAAVVIDGRLYRASDFAATRLSWVQHFESPIFNAVSMPAARRLLAKNALRDY